MSDSSSEHSARSPHRKRFSGLMPIDAPRSNARRSLALAWLTVSLAIVVGMVLMHRRSIRQEEMHWSRQLELSVAQSADAASALSRGQIQIMEQVASNVSVQLYMTQLIQSESSAPEDGGFIPERQYLENLLRATAMKGGFQPNNSADAMVDANVTPPLHAGVALLDAKGQVVAATRAMPPIRERLEKFLADASKVRASASEPVESGQGLYAIYFQAPIFAVQADAAEPNFIGRVVGVRLLDAKLLQHVLTSKLAEAQSALVIPDADRPLLLQQGEGGLVTVPLPRAPGSAGNSMATTYPISTPRGIPVENAALGNPGNVYHGLDANGVDSFAVAQVVEGTQLQLIQKLDRTLVMQEVQRQLFWLWSAVLTGLIGFGIFLWAMVRHSAALRAAMVAEQYQALAMKLDRKSRLLELVTEHTPNTITILDDQGRVCFTNWQPPAGVEVSLEDTQGKTLTAMLGADAAKNLMTRNQEALATGQMQMAVELRETAAGKRHFQCLHLPLGSIPVDLPFLSPDSRGVLIIEEDITLLMQERERQEKTLRRMVDCLVEFVDRRDPYAAHHSAQVALLSHAIAGTMEQSEITQETAELAGKLLNVGKMHVPEEILAQSASLDKDGINRIREAITSSAEVVEGISFRGPVAETIRQSLERMDGQGPQGMRGEEILLSARIISVANAFVGMTSARAYRAPLSTDAAIGQLMKAAGSAFDPAVVAALVHYLETQGGRAEMSQISV